MFNSMHMPGASGLDNFKLCIVSMVATSMSCDYAELQIRVGIEDN